MKKIYIIVGGILILTSSAFMIWKFNSKKEESEQPTSSIVEQSNYDQEKSQENKNNEENKSSEEQKNKFPVNAEIKSLTYSEIWDASSEKKALDIKIDYLVIENKNNSKEIDNLNKLLKEKAQQRFDEVKKELKEYLEEYKNNINEYNLENNYNIYVCEDTSEITKNNENGIISVCSRYYWDAGGPYPHYGGQSFVLDCNTGKKLSIFDVIQGDEMKIREMIGKEIDKSDWAKVAKKERETGRPVDPYADFSNMFINKIFGDSLYDLKNQSFFLKDKCLVIDFGRGDIGDASLGAPSFDFSYDTIRKYGFSIDNKFN